MSAISTVSWLLSSGIIRTVATNAPHLQADADKIADGFITLGKDAAKFLADATPIILALKGTVTGGNALTIVMGLMNSGMMQAITTQAPALKDDADKITGDVMTLGSDCEKLLADIRPITNSLKAAA